MTMRFRIIRFVHRAAALALAGLLGAAAAAHAQGTGSPVTATATAASMSVPVRATATLSVPQGTASVRLSYLVSTVEYPYYVQAQSVYNDTWSVVVQAGSSGQQLFSISRQINSQLSVDPVWQPDGSTGEVGADIDTSSLTASGPADLTLFVSATNVGDSALATSVRATLGGGGLVTINSATPDVVSPTDGNSSYYSVPRPGDVNRFTRTFDLDITKPDTASVQNVQVTLLNPGPAQMVLDEGVGSSVVEVSPSLLRVRVTWASPVTSSVQTDPPPSHELKFKFRVTVDDGGVAAFAEKESGLRQGLWRMPTGFSRFPAVIRDPGGDDWASRATYNWLVANAGLMTAINDISGEHARDIGHDDHQRGTDIDIYHFYSFGAGLSGGQNYAALRENVLLAATNSSDPTQQALIEAARTRVDGWIGGTRNGIDGLAANTSVTAVLYARGLPGGGLPNGWAQQLLTTGQTRVNGQLFATGAPSWSNTKYVPRNDHNDHAHVTLNVR
jgi:hypothetical protein